MIVVVLIGAVTRGCGGLVCNLVHRNDNFWYATRKHTSAMVSTSLQAVNHDEVEMLVYVSDLAAPCAYLAFARKICGGLLRNLAITCTF